MIEKNQNYKSKLPIVIHRSIKAKIFDYYIDRKKNYWAYSMGLYCFLYDTVRYQKNNRVWTTNSFIKKGTGLSERIIPQIKKDLIKMELIEIHRERNSQGKLGKQYIEVKFVWKPDAVERLFYQETDETVEYKIARELLINNFIPYEEIQSSQEYEFEPEVRGTETTLYADTFYFNDDYLLVAKASFHTYEENIDYIVPKEHVNEIILDIVSRYNFTFKGVLNALKAEL